MIEMGVSARINLPATGNGVASQVAVHMLQERTPSCRLTVRPTTILRSTTYIPTLLRHYYYYYSRQWQQQLRLDSAMETCTGRTVGFCPDGTASLSTGEAEELWHSWIWRDSADKSIDGETIDIVSSSWS